MHKSKYHLLTPNEVSMDSSKWIDDFMKLWVKHLVEALVKLREVYDKPCLMTLAAISWTVMTAMMMIMQNVTDCHVISPQLASRCCCNIISVLSAHLHVYQRLLSIQLHDVDLLVVAWAGPSHGGQCKTALQQQQQLQPCDIASRCHRLIAIHCSLQSAKSWY